jgi:DHA2 family multidrug resistance protein
LKDWFSSTEILVEGIVTLSAFYFFIVHTATYKRPFLNIALFADTNFLIGNIIIFIMGVVIFAILALLPPMLQKLMGYPVVTTGLVTAPRGVGLMLAMVVVGRLVGRIDARVLMASGLVMTVVSLREMTQFSLLMDAWPVIWSGLLQGFGVGFVYIPLATVSFATLPVALRTEGTAFFNLLRNLGSSIGISIVQALLTRNIQVVHAGLAQQISPYNAGANFALQAAHLDLTSRHSLLLLNAEVTRQAGMIAYIDDFKLIMVMTLLLVPLLLLFRRGRNAAPPEPATAIGE